MTQPTTGPRSITQCKEWWYATTLLVVVFALFIVATLRLAGGGPWPLLRAFAEAATVGALADWFAVVALFKAPLGLDFLVGRFGFIGHLAVLPHSQSDIGQRAGDYVGTHVLTPSAIAKALRGVPMAELIGRGLMDRKPEIVDASVEDSWPPLKSLKKAGTGISIDLIARSLTGNAKIKAKVDTVIASGIQAWFEGNPGVVASMIRAEITDIPAAQFTGHAQSMIGRELQFIRINGTLVGGIVGLLLYAVAMVVG